MSDLMDSIEVSIAGPSTANIAIVDKRPYFEVVLCFGVQQGYIDAAQLQAIICDGAKGSIQVADHFGTSHLQLDLEKARTRIVNLVSLYLEESCGKDLEKAARSLQDQRLLFHSRSGNALLKQLHALPESTIYGDIKGQSLKDFQEERTLAKPFSLSAYLKELKRRQDNVAVLAAGLWCADAMQVPRAMLDFVCMESVIRSAVLLRLGAYLQVAEAGVNHSQFARLVDNIRVKTLASGKLRISKILLNDIPEPHRAIIDVVRREIEKNDAALLLDSTMPLDVLLNLFESRYFILESGIDEVEQHDAFVSKAWRELTGGKEDPYSRLTLFMCLASGMKPKTILSELEAKAMVRQIRKEGINDAAVSTFIEQAAPFDIKDNLLSFWQEEFLPEAQDVLLDEDDTRDIRALRFLRENCNIKTPAKKSIKKNQQ